MERLFGALRESVCQVRSDLKKGVENGGPMGASAELSLVPGDAAQSLFPSPFAYS
jgi:hypothetical protein